MAKPANTSNEYDPAVVNPLLKQIDGYHADLLSERGSYMATCRGIRESIKGVYDKARTEGIPVKELKVMVANRIDEARIAARVADLEAEQQQNLAMLAATEDVKDLPLWRAARKPVPGIDVVRTGQTPSPMF